MKISNLPTTPGIYIFRNQEKKIIYVGKAINIKKRVSSYFQKNLVIGKTRQMIGQIVSIETVKTSSEFEALLLEARLIKKNQPKYNVIARDDKHPLYIKITSEVYPKITTVRREDDTKSTYFGPFPSSRTVRDTLRYLRHIFPFCTDKRIRKKPCFYSFIGLCSPCPNVVEQLSDEDKAIEKKRYRHNLNTIKRILSGKSTSVLQDLEKEMGKYAKQENYHAAAVVKKQLEKLRYLISPRFSPASYMENPNLYSDLREKELNSLAQLLEISTPNRIEGYDISNIMGKEATGSMVVFTGGEKDANNYRRFKIKTKNTPDDFHMIREMLTRRLRHDEWDMPDLFLIDGGAGQVSTALGALKERGVNVPLVGLAKRFEEIIVPIEKEDELGFKVIKIPIGSPALSLLQRIRDEAHRYARSYHHLLRKKKMMY